jgi:hypothetical protein
MTSLLAVCIICISFGCDRSESNHVVAALSSQPRTWDAYTTCPEPDAKYKLEFTVRDSHGETHKDTFFIRVTAIHGDIYPSHPSGFASSDGPNGGFNKSCYIENGTATGVAVRFLLASKRDGHSELNLNELVWGTIGRRTSVDLPQDCSATFEFVRLGSD